MNAKFVIPAQERDVAVRSEAELLHKAVSLLRFYINTSCLSVTYFSKIRISIGNERGCEGGKCKSCSEQELNQENTGREAGLDRCRTVWSKRHLLSCSAGLHELFRPKPDGQGRDFLIFKVVRA